MERYFVHFKGGLYKLIAIASHSETLEEFAVYQALYGTGKVWIRPINMFFSKVNIHGVEVERFKEITKKEMLCLLQSQKEHI